MISYTFMGTKHVVPLKLAWERGADVFDYIERFHNPRMRGRVATQRSEAIRRFKTVRGNGVEPNRGIHRFRFLHSPEGSLPPSVTLSTFVYWNITATITS